MEKLFSSKKKCFHSYIKTVAIYAIIRHTNLLAKDMKNSHSPYNQSLYFPKAATLLQLIWRTF